MLTTDPSETAAGTAERARVLRLCAWQAHLARTGAMHDCGGSEWHLGYKIACDVIAGMVARGEDAPAVPPPCCEKKGGCERD